MAILGYPKEVLDFMKLRLETCNSATAIARETIKRFEIPQDEESVRKYISKIKNKKAWKAQTGDLPLRDQKVLFFDIETSYVKAKVWRPGKQHVNVSNIEGVPRIICVSYKWLGEDKVHTLTWDKNQNDKQLVKKFIKIMAEANELVAHNGDRFDIKQIRTRAFLNGELMFTKYRSFDTLKKSRGFFSFLSNKLDYLGQVAEIGRKLDHEGIYLWEQVQEGKTQKIREDYLKKMVAYCEQDVILLEDFYSLIRPYVSHNTNHAVANGGSKWQCPSCASKNVQFHHMDTTAMGYIKRHMKCNKCNVSYHVSNRTYGDFLQYLFQTGQISK
jgi:uncharacterized protein YprB with RNaseH-like and TPR domain